MRYPLAWLGVAAVATFLTLFLVLPVASVIGGGCSWSLLREALLHPVYRAGLVNALGVAVCATCLSLAIAVPLALLSARFRFPGQRLAEALILIPLITPPFTGALGIVQIFGRYGALNALLAHLGCGGEVDWLGKYRFAAVALVEALHLYPILYLTLVAGLAKIDRHLLEAARSLGAGAWLTLRRVTLPLVAPSLLAGGSIVFVWSLTELGTPLLLDYHRVTPVQIYDGLMDIQAGSLLPFTLVLILLALAGLAYGLGRLVLLGRRRDAGAGSKTPGGGPAVTRLRPPGAAAAWSVFLAVFACAALPQAAVALLALSRDWYRSVLPTGFTTTHLAAALGHELVLPSVLNSLTYATAATTIALVMGTFIAWVVERWRPPGWRILDLAGILPLAIPGIILAFGYLRMVGHIDVLRQWMDPIRDPTLILIIAYAVRRMPYVIRAAAAGFSRVPVALEEAAATLGAGRWTRLRRILLPLLAPSLIAGGILTFSFSMLEVADSLILAQKAAFFPITKVIFELQAMLGSGPVLACAFSLWAMVVLGLAIAAARLAAGRGDRPATA